MKTVAYRQAFLFYLTVTLFCGTHVGGSEGNRLQLTLDTEL